MPVLFISPVGCDKFPVPTSATNAAVQIQTSIRTALAKGKRCVLVDVLTASIDARSRTFDDAAAETIFTSMLHAVRPILPQVHVLLPGPSAALRVRRWLSETEMVDVSVGVLGVEDESSTPDLLVIVDPPGRGDRILDFRRTIRDAHGKNLPVLIHNQPRPDELYKILGYGGEVPYELLRYEPAFVLAPFALQGSQEAPPHRFVLFRKYPGKWELWRHFGATDDSPFANEKIKGSYTLVQKYENRPSDNALMIAVSNSIKST